MTSMSWNLSGYEAAYQRAAFFIWPDAGYLQIGGEDRAAFLQRQTTNDVRLLSPERAIVTVLTSPTARILDVFLLLQEPETIGVITLPGRGTTTGRYLRGRIFFMDRVTVTDASSAIAQIDLEGPRAADVLRALGVALAPALDQVVHVTIGGAPARVIGRKGLAGLGYRLLVPAEALERLIKALEASGAESLTAESYEALRVESGLPGPRGELTEEYTPLEVHLQDAISDRKGCYTGQEIIARQITYDKVTRHLVGLQAEAPVAIGDQVLAEDRQVGVITSAAVSPRFGPIALAVLKRPYDQPGTVVTAVGENVSARATVTSLPFSR
ncbi:MAG: glycine cleavage T C-terminal barrel domain-containing protein [Anaerolineae bacterium]|nr:hypothetical protein [Anaerolineae bacterium]MDW8098322.1 glycine cleavage T C-terminal barrel domain-containing protein [Anaerolineae bacterium]